MKSNLLNARDQAEKLVVEVHAKLNNPGDILGSKDLADIQVTYQELVALREFAVPSLYQEAIKNPKLASSQKEELNSLTQYFLTNLKKLESNLLNLEKLVQKKLDENTKLKINELTLKNFNKSYMEPAKALKKAIKQLKGTLEKAKTIANLELYNSLRYLIVQYQAQINSLHILRTRWFGTNSFIHPDKTWEKGYDLNTLQKKLNKIIKYDDSQKGVIGKKDETTTFLYKSLPTFVHADQGEMFYKNILQVREKNITSSPNAEAVVTPSNKSKPAMVSPSTEKTEKESMPNDSTNQPEKFEEYIPKFLKVASKTISKLQNNIDENVKILEEKIQNSTPTDAEAEYYEATRLRLKNIMSQLKNGFSQLLNSFTSIKSTTDLSAKIAAEEKLSEQIAEFDNELTKLAAEIKGVEKEFKTGAEKALPSQSDVAFNFVKDKLNEQMNDYQRLSADIGKQTIPLSKDEMITKAKALENLLRDTDSVKQVNAFIKFTDDSTLTSKAQLWPEFLKLEKDILDHLIKDMEKSIKVLPDVKEALKDSPLQQTIQKYEEQAQENAALVSKLRTVLLGETKAPAINPSYNYILAEEYRKSLNKLMNEVKNWYTKLPTQPISIEYLKEEFDALKKLAIPKMSESTAASLQESFNKENVTLPELYQLLQEYQINILNETMKTLEDMNKKLNADIAVLDTELLTAQKSQIKSMREFFSDEAYQARRARAELKEQEKEKDLLKLKNAKTEEWKDRINGLKQNDNTPDTTEKFQNKVNQLIQFINDNEKLKGKLGATIVQLNNLKDIADTPGFELDSASKIIADVIADVYQREVIEPTLSNFDVDAKANRDELDTKITDIDKELDQLTAIIRGENPNPTENEINQINEKINILQTQRAHIETLRNNIEYQRLPINTRELIAMATHLKNTTTNAGIKTNIDSVINRTQDESLRTEFIRLKALQRIILDNHHTDLGDDITTLQEHLANNTLPNFRKYNQAIATIENNISVMDGLIPNENLFERQKQADADKIQLHLTGINANRAASAALNTTFREYLRLPSLPEDVPLTNDELLRLARDAKELLTDVIIVAPDVRLSAIIAELNPAGDAVRARNIAQQIYAKLHESNILNGFNLEASFSEHEQFLSRLQTPLTEEENRKVEIIKSTEEDFAHEIQKRQTALTDLNQLWESKLSFEKANAIQLNTLRKIMMRDIDIALAQLRAYQQGLTAPNRRAENLNELNKRVRGLKRLITHPGPHDNNGFDIGALNVIEGQLAPNAAPLDDRQLLEIQQELDRITGDVFTQTRNRLERDKNNLKNHADDVQAATGPDPLTLNQQIALHHTQQTINQLDRSYASPGRLMRELKIAMPVAIGAKGMKQNLEDEIRLLRNITSSNADLNKLFERATSLIEGAAFSERLKSDLSRIKEKINKQLEGQRRIAGISAADIKAIDDYSIQFDKIVETIRSQLDYVHSFAHHSWTVEVPPGQTHTQVQEAQKQEELARLGRAAGAGGIVARTGTDAPLDGPTEKLAPNKITFHTYGQSIFSERLLPSGNYLAELLHLGNELSKSDLVALAMQIVETQRQTAGLEKPFIIREIKPPLDAAFAETLVLCAAKAGWETKNIVDRSGYEITSDANMKRLFGRKIFGKKISSGKQSTFDNMLAENDLRIATEPTRKRKLAEDIAIEQNIISEGTNLRASPPTKKLKK